MTVFGIDCSHYDMARGPMDWPAMYRDGIRFATCKATEGATYRDPHLGVCLNGARAAGVPVLGAYHVVRTGVAIDAQVHALTAYLDEAVPWWRTHPNFLLQVDLELWPYDHVPASVGVDFAHAARAATGKYVVVYASRGQYGNSIPPGVDLWNAAYPSSRTAHYAALYPGDNATGWNVYSGRTPVIWQYASTATIGGQPTCDANAYRGTLEQLLALTNTGDDMAAAEEALALLKRALNGFTDKGTPTENLLGTWISDLQHGQATQAAQLAAIAVKVGAPTTVVLSDVQFEALAAAITTHPDNQLGDKDIPAIVKALKAFYAPAQAAP